MFECIMNKFLCNSVKIYFVKIGELVIGSLSFKVDGASTGTLKVLAKQLNAPLKGIAFHFFREQSF